MSLLQKILGVFSQGPKLETTKFETPKLETSVYYHMKQKPRWDDDDEIDWQSNLSFANISEKIVDYKGRQLIVLQREQSSMQGTPHVHVYHLVPGFVSGPLKRYDPETKSFVDRETNATKVDLVKEESSRNEIIRYLSAMGIDDVSLWWL